MRRADVIVVGAGVLGTFHAYYAAQKGYSTLLVERNSWPSDASARNFGIIAQSIVGPSSPWAGFARATAQIYRSIQERHDISLREAGCLYLASTAPEDAALREFAERATPEYRCEYLQAREAVRRYPFIRESYCTGALFFPDDLTLEPRRMLRQLIPYLVQSGRVEYVPNTAVVAVESTGQRCTVRDAAGGRYEAGRVIICSGAEYRTLYPALFTASGLQICKLQMMQTAPQPGLHLPHPILSGLSIGRYPAFHACPSYPLLDQQPIDEALRAYGIHVLFKQAADGSVVIGDSHEYREPSAASELEEATNSAINAAILSYGQQMLHLPSWTPQTLWNGYYLVYPHHDVYTETIDGAIHVVTGIGGKGMTTGPGYARHSVESILV